MHTFEFKVTLRGTGKDKVSAWSNAVDAFAEDPGFPEDEDITQIEDSEDE
jgi:hypothetical protein